MGVSVWETQQWRWLINEVGSVGEFPWKGMCIEWGGPPRQTYSIFEWLWWKYIPSYLQANVRICVRGVIFSPWSIWLRRNYSSRWNRLHRGSSGNSSWPNFLIRLPPMMNGGNFPLLLWWVIWNIWGEGGRPWCWFRILTVLSLSPDNRNTCFLVWVCLEKGRG